MTTFEIKEEQSIQIDDKGNLILLNQAINDTKFIYDFYKNIKAKDHYYVSNVNDREFLIEAFDKILVANNIKEKGNKLYIEILHDLSFEIDLKQIYLDMWDRIVGYTSEQIPFVLAKPAHEKLFEICDFDDDSINFQGTKYNTPDYYESNTSVNEASWWSGKYRDNPKPGWDLDSHHPAFAVALSTLKLPRSKIIVLGCGAGHDANLFSQHGHIVTAVDFSEEAIQKAKKRYGDKINWIQEDIFQLDHKNTYDIVVDHTNYCAVQPKRRKELVRLWQQLLQHNGHLLGVFFSMDKRSGPPFGGSEWELLKLVEKKFDAEYWNRLKSAPNYSRYGIEFMTYLRKMG